MDRRKVLAIVGTRPEAIKMAPVILALREEPWADVHVVATAQHREMLDQMLDFFGIAPDSDLGMMRPGQSLATLTARMLEALDALLVHHSPDLVLAQGDTTTVLAAGLASHYRGVCFGHIEAGLRTADLRNPFPEEANRRLVGQIADWHFAPTAAARENLIAAGVSPSAVAVTGNTVIDALSLAAGRANGFGKELANGQRMVLITTHRRESFGAPLGRILDALLELSATHPEVAFVFPLHPNPNVSGLARRRLMGIPNLFLTAPLDYGSFVAAMKRAHVILTDSGGVQEEAPALGTPVLVLRDATERPEAVACGAARLVGTQSRTIVRETTRLLTDATAWRDMARGGSPYGDGHAARRIVEFLRRALAPGPAIAEPA